MDKYVDRLMCTTVGISNTSIQRDIIIFNYFFYNIDCEIGYWGEDCKVKCSDTCGGEGRIQSCDAVNGTCVCNKCWDLSDEGTCSVGMYPSTNSKQQPV